VRKTEQTKESNRIGLFRGTFDPIHSGHIAFALQAISLAKLSEVYFLPEQTPKHKQAVESFENRLAMISQAIKPYENLGLLKLPDMNGSVERILPDLKGKFGDARLVFLMGSDVAKTIYHWPDVDALCTGNELFIGMRRGDDINGLKQMLAALTIKPVASTTVDATDPAITSSAVRQQMERGIQADKLPENVHKYAISRHLYKH
jgi:nicotinate-nucleotide adenylyltransferase